MINILISVDSNYLDKAQTMLFSMRLNSDDDITVYLLNHRLKETEIKQFQQYLKGKCHIQLVVIDVSKTALDDLPVGRYSVEMYFRILAQFVLPLSVDRILWLDADIVILKNIAEFYYQTFDDKKYIVCAESQNEEEWLKKQKKVLGLPEKYVYFNSGVMLMNLEQLRKETDMDYILKQCELLRDVLRCPDQDILNYLYQGQVKYAEKERFNYQLTAIDRIPDKDEHNIVILHYSGYRKPWNYWQITNAAKHYWRVRRQQGDSVVANKAYLLKIWDLTVTYLRELKNILVG